MRMLSSMGKGPIRFFSQTNQIYYKFLKVAILGSTSKSGKCLSVFLKHSPIIDELALYDRQSVHGFALELNHIDSKCKVSGYDLGDLGLKKTLENAKVVIISDNECYGKNISDTLKTNAKILSELIFYIIKFCPRAMIAIAMNPINSLVPLAVKAFRKAKFNESNRIFGIVTDNCIRANSIAAKVMGYRPEYVMVPVIGGSCSKSCIPLFSQTRPCKEFRNEEIRYMTQCVRMPDFDKKELNKRNIDTFFTNGFAAARFCASLCKAVRHERGIIECAYVSSNVIPEVSYFSSLVELGPDGVQKYLSTHHLTEMEHELLEETIPILKNDIKKGEMLAAGLSIYEE